MRRGRALQAMFLKNKLPFLFFSSISKEFNKKLMSTNKCQMMKFVEGGGRKSLIDCVNSRPFVCLPLCGKTICIRRIFFTFTDKFREKKSWYWSPTNALGRGVYILANFCTSSLTCGTNFIYFFKSIFVNKRAW